MPKICYVPKKFAPGTLTVIDQANTIIAEYQEQGFLLTLRQLCYQFVARDLLPNKVTEYKRLGGIINDARCAGLIDWDAIEDRTRNLQSISSWSDPADIVRSAAHSFREDLWKDQPHRVEVWIEKEALAGVFERVCDEVRVPFFACRGYTSQSEMWAAAQRLKRYARNGQTPMILHFGDHDPSGVDMTRDIIDRLELFGGRVIPVNRLALNMDQIDQYNPPPNPAKEMDSRFTAYVERFGNESWELDALDPTVLAGLVTDAVENLRDPDAWAAAEEHERIGRDHLRNVSTRWTDVEAFLRNGDAT